MVSQRVKVVHPQGLQMRPAQLFVTEMSKFDCAVTVVANGKSVNAKSILYLMAACIKQGAEIEIRCEGPQEAEALAAAIQMVESGADSN